MILVFYKNIQAIQPSVEKGEDSRHPPRKYTVSIS